MKRVLIMTIVLLNFLGSRAQKISQVDSLDINNASMLVLSNGEIATDTSWNASAGYFIPKDSGNTAIYTMSLWVSGRDAVTLDTHLMATTYGYFLNFSRRSIGEGPVADNYNTTFNNRYGRLWKLNKTEIDIHRNSWFLPGYSLNPTIATWPAHGDTTNGEAYYLAPFIDFNQNGKYDPQNGDYPCIKGDQAVYTISNDDNVDTGMYFYSQFPIEIHLMAYGFANGNILENTTFLEYKIINRSPNKKELVYAGIFKDADLGCADDDYVGCDSSLNLFYAYNGDNLDEDCRGAIGYKLNLPFVGITFLNHPMTSFIYYDRGIVPLRGDPVTEEDHYNYMNAVWKDGSPLVVGGNGHPSDPNATSQKTKYMFPADPRDTVGWNEFTAGNPPFDRRGVGSTGPFTIQPNESIELAFAVVFTQDTTVTPTPIIKEYLDVFDKFKKDVAFVRSFYNINNNYCSYWATGEEEISWKNDIRLFPNPAENEFNIQLPEGNLRLSMEIYDSFGKLIHSEQYLNELKYRIDVSNWSPGMYFVRIYNEDGVWVEKVMVE